MKQSGNADEDSLATCQKLRGDLKAVFNILPKDMHQLLLMNPERAALLQDTLEEGLREHPSAQAGLRNSSTPPR